MFDILVGIEADPKKKAELNQQRRRLSQLKRTNMELQNSQNIYRNFKNVTLPVTRFARA
jgi:cell shape-determining protein MreC